MSYLSYIVTYVVALGVLVVVHEWGHFVVARLFGIRVDEFSIGFGPRAARLGKIGNTEYNIRWIPLGGFVKIAGMEADEEPLNVAADKVKGLTSGSSSSAVPVTEPTPPLGIEPPAVAEAQDPAGEFYSHPIWQRSLVIFAGPLMSFLLGYVIIFGLTVSVGIPTGPVMTRVAEVVAGSEAQKMGLRAGDNITAIDQTHIISGDQMVLMIHGDANKLIHLTVQRGGETVQLAGTPRPTVIDGKTFGALGFEPNAMLERYSLLRGFRITNLFTGEWFNNLGDLIKQHNLKTLRRSAGGPIFIAQATKHAVQAGGDSLPLLMAQLSMSLAIFNLLPIPILDGGHLLAFLIEKFRRGRRLTPEQQQSYMLAGLAIIGILVVLIMFNDIVRSIHPNSQ